MSPNQERTPNFAGPIQGLLNYFKENIKCMNEYRVFIQKGSNNGIS